MLSKQHVQCVAESCRNENEHFYTNKFDSIWVDCSFFFPQNTHELICRIRFRVHYLYNVRIENKSPFPEHDYNLKKNIYLLRTK